MKKVFSVFLSFLMVFIFWANSICLPADAQKLAGSETVSLSIAEEGIVLLKNDGSCLPFGAKMSIGFRNCLPTDR